MEDIKIFESAQFGQIRTLQGASGEPLFCLKDVCEAIGLDAKHYKKKLPDEMIVRVPMQHGRYKYMNYVTESGLYETILHGKSAKATVFRSWLTNEVLPKTRKTGGYIPVRSGASKEDVVATTIEIFRKTMAYTESRMSVMQEKISKWEKLLEEQLPKVEYFDKVLSSESALTVNMIADCLGITAQRLNQLLCIWGIQYRQSGVYHLYSEYRDKDLVYHRPYVTENGGKVHTSQIMHWTEKGKRFIIEMYNQKSKIQKIWI